MRIFKIALFLLLILAMFGALLHPNGGYEPLTLEYLLKVLSTVSYYPVSWISIVETWEALAETLSSYFDAPWNLLLLLEMVYELLTGIISTVISFGKDVFGYIAQFFALVDLLIFNY